MIDLNNLKSTYIIAEIGANHNGDMDLAMEMIKVAHECGCDAVKFQYFDEYNMITQKHLDELDKGIVKLENVSEFETPELGLKGVKAQLKAFAFSKEEIIKVQEYSKELGIDFGCTAEDVEGIEFLKEINVDFIKLPSSDCNNLSLVKASIATKFPIILSTGMADLSEIDRVYRIFKKGGCENFALLHCISIYPPKDEIIDLNFIDTLNEIYDCEIGYSDHSIGFSIPLASIAKNAKIIEKHFTLDKDMPGWDHKVSANPEEMKMICEEGKRIYNALGNRYKVVSPEEIDKRTKFRKSLTTKFDLKKGDAITEDNIVFKRPGTGIPSDLLETLLGRKINRNIAEDTTLFFEDLL